MSEFRNLLTTKSHTFKWPENVREDIDRYVLTHSKNKTPEDAPFYRQLDFWAFSIATASALELEPVDPKVVKLQKFIDTKSVDIPEALCGLLAVLALKHLGPDDENVDSPPKIIELGNCLAAAGVQRILRTLKDDNFNVTPLDKMLGFIKKTREH